MTEREELEITLRAVEHKTYYTYFGEEHDNLLAIANKLNAKIKQLDVKGIDSDPPRKGSR